ncbi:FadR/GntR family transcriptional regulator [Actinomadura napierensis]|uniref:GntR family transcriptional regulator n=1 Tax=Actinomadura napierensis TaxID=267854 RepID=A0ABN3AHD3_9ACTN
MAGPVGPGEAFDDAPALRAREWGRRPAGADRRPPRLSRAETTAELLISIAEAASPGGRLGSKSELRDRCSVSVGTFNEAMRIAQSRGVVTVRPGPGGGVFAAEPSPMVRLGNSVLALDAGETSVAEAMRIRDALDPLLIEDALWHASLADIAEMRGILAEMAVAVERDDATAFVHANWSLHARIAAVSPHAMLRSLYINLLDQIESHTLAVLPGGAQPLPEYISARHALHEAIVDALESHDREGALRLIAEHNTSNTQSGDPAAAAADRVTSALKRTD